MPADPIAALSIRIKQTILDARAFHGRLEAFFAAPGYTTLLTNSENEIVLGQSSRRLASDLQSLDGAELPVQVELGVNALRCLFVSLMSRWKWDLVIGPDGDAFLARQRERWEENRRSYLSAVRSHVKAHATGKIGDRPLDGYFYMAKDAEREMIPPCEPFVESEEELERLKQAWIFSPYLGPEFPTRMLDDLKILARAVQDIEAGVRGTTLEASGNSPHVSTPPPQNPDVIRGLGEVSFTYSPSTLPTSEEPEDFSRRREWIAWAEELHRNEHQMAEARRVDPMPDPETLTVGEMIDFVTFFARTPQDWRAMPEIGQAFARRDKVLSTSPGWKAFVDWKDVEHHRKTPVEAAKELLALLVDRLRKPSEELRLTSLLDAVRLLGQSDAAIPLAPPRGDEKSASSPAGAPQPKPEDTGAQSKLLKGRRGRRKGQDKIGEALTRLAAMLKDGLPVKIPSIAKDVGCTPENLRQSSKFMDAYESLIRAFARLPRGRKEDGIVEAEDEGNY
jgi:hypothetical protein